MSREVPNIILFGAGRFGQIHLRHYADLSREGRCNVLAVVDPDSAKAALAKKYNLQFAQEYDPQFYLSLDAVVITTPTDTHYSLVKQFLEEGKDVFVEKPTATTTNRVGGLVSLAQEKERVLNVGYLWRFIPALQEAKDRLSEVGRIRTVEAYNLNDRPPRTDSGIIVNLGIHPIDAINFVLAQTPQRVSCTHRGLDIDSGLEDEVIISLQYNGFPATVKARCGYPHRKKELTVIGDRGEFTVSFLDQSFTRRWRENGSDCLELRTPVTPVDLLRLEAEKFLEAIKSRRSDNLGQEDVRVMRICELANQAGKEGATIQF